MTTRELYNATIKALYEYGTDEAIDLKAEFEALLAKMDAQSDARRAKQAEKAAEKQAAKAPIRDALLMAMDFAENPKTASMLIADAGLEETVKPASVPSLMRPLVESGLVGKVDVKIAGKGTQRGYVKL